MSFLDSFRFLQKSLDILSRSLTDADFSILRKHFPDKIKNLLLKQNRIYPISYTDSIENFNEEKLPNFGPNWTNTLSGKIDVSKEDVQTANKIWDAIEYENIGDYHDLYLKCNTKLLAYVFEKFRTLFRDTLELDPIHNYSATNISWDALLKTTKAELDLLTDIDMLLFCEKAIRRGLNGIAEKRYMKANNPYLADYDSTKPSTSGLFRDVVNHYGGSMKKKMPTGNFKWVEKSLEEILGSSDESKEGYFVIVDLHYALNLLDPHNVFPLASEKESIENDFLFLYQQKLNPKTEHTKNKWRHFLTRKIMSVTIQS